MNRRSFLSAAAISLPILHGCSRRGNGHSGGAAVTDATSATRATRWNLGHRDSFAVGVDVSHAPKNRGAVFVVRKNRKIYALSSICTHLGCVLDPAPCGFACGCHGSRYALDGARLSGPAKRPLVRYGISVNASDEVLIDKSITFDPKHADDLGSYIFIY